jgi:hypothetical protein
MAASFVLTMALIRSGRMVGKFEGSFPQGLKPTFIFSYLRHD